MTLLWWRLKTHLESRHLLEIGRSAARTLGASSIAALAAAFVAGALERSSAGRMLPGMAGATVFVVVFFVAARLLGSEELATVLGAIRRRRA
jgi:lipopolysaccharide export LptBFGC system permease protein LptF